MSPSVSYGTLHLCVNLYVQPCTMRTLRLLGYNSRKLTVQLLHSYQLSTHGQMLCRTSPHLPWSDAPAVLHSIDQQLRRPLIMRWQMIPQHTLRKHRYDKSARCPSVVAANTLTHALGIALAPRGISEVSTKVLQLRSPLHPGHGNSPLDKPVSQRSHSDPELNCSHHPMTALRKRQSIPISRHWSLDVSRCKW